MQEPDSLLSVLALQDLKFLLLQRNLHQLPFLRLKQIEDQTKQKRE
jgi:hypothetical protein